MQTSLRNYKIVTASFIFDISAFNFWHPFNLHAKEQFCRQQKHAKQKQQK